MPYRGFNFFVEDHSYEEIESFCLSKGFLVEKNVHEDDSYPEHIRKSSRDGITVFTVNKFISVRRPFVEGQPESDVWVGNVSFGVVADKARSLRLAVRGQKDLTKVVELEQAQAELGSLKKEVSKVYTVLRKKFMIPDDQLHQRRAEVIESRKERGLDPLGKPLKKGLLGKIFG